jgi:hypothetical protein
VGVGPWPGRFPRLSYWPGCPTCAAGARVFACARDGISVGPKVT